MDLTTEFLQWQKMGEIGRILSRLPQDQQERFEEEWKIIYPKVRKRNYYNKLRQMGFAILISPVILWLVHVFKIYSENSIAMAGFILLAILISIWIDNEDSRDELIREKRKLAVSIYQEYFEKKRKE